MKEMHLYEVDCGGRIGATDHYYVVAEDIGKAMLLVSARHRAKTMEDLPKPFNLRLVDGPVLLPVPKKVRR